MTAYKIVILGGINTGKSSIIRRYISGLFHNDEKSTIGVSFQSKTMEDGDVLEIWDTAGQERFRSLVPLYYRNAKIIIIVYEITSVASYTDAVRWVDEINRVNPTATLALVANKTDLEECRKVTTAMHKQIATRCTFNFETSALTGSNINVLFTTLHDAAPDLPQRPHPETFDICFPIPGLNSTKYCC
jgi:Ras-related protein Rab-5C